MIKGNLYRSATFDQKNRLFCCNNKFHIILCFGFYDIEVDAVDVISPFLDDPLIFHGSQRNLFDLGREPGYVKDGCFEKSRY